MSFLVPPKKQNSVGELALEKFSLRERDPPLGRLVGLAVVHLGVEDEADQAVSQLVPELEHVPPQLVRVLRRVRPEKVNIQGKVCLSRQGKLVEGQPVHILLGLVAASALGHSFEGQCDVEYAVDDEPVCSVLDLECWEEDVWFVVLQALVDDVPHNVRVVGVGAPLVNHRPPEFTVGKFDW